MNKDFDYIDLLRYKEQKRKFILFCLARAASLIEFYYLLALIKINREYMFQKRQFLMISALAALFIFSFINTQARIEIKGVVSDETTNETLIGVQIVVEGSQEGAVTDVDGRFTLITSASLPLSLNITYIGYESQTINIKAIPDFMEIKMSFQHGVQEHVVVSGSRLQERFLEASSSVERLSFLDIIENPAPDFYSGIANLKGVQISHSGLGFYSVNTRGFTNVSNARLVQYVDGMDTSIPGQNFSLANTLGPGELDIEQVELLYGPGSALYGPNVFNGALLMKTKSPFEYQGVSAYLRQGSNQRNTDESAPFIDVGIRYANVVNEKFAFKINASYMRAQDWVSGGHGHEAHTITPTTHDSTSTHNIHGEQHTTNSHLHTSNIYGDEAALHLMLTNPHTGADSMALIHRTGIAEHHIYNPKINNFKLQASLHFRPTENMELVYDARYSVADYFKRSGEFYISENSGFHTHKLEAKSKNFFLRGYYSASVGGISYRPDKVGEYIQQGLKPDSAWATDFAEAFNGNVSFIQPGDVDAARGFADRDMAVPGSEEFESLKFKTIHNPDRSAGGSRLINNSSFLHLEGNYQLDPFIPFMGLQLGANLRKYNLSSNGTLFNDGLKSGFPGSIPITEYGAYMLASKKLLNDHISIVASLRYDKNQNFDGKINTRISTVFTLDKNRRHNIRLLAQTGFRNPLPEEVFMAQDFGDRLLLGSLDRNHQNFQLEGYDGFEIHHSLVTPNDWQAFLDSDRTDSSLLKQIHVPLLQQEKVTTFEAGYRGLLSSNFFLDLNVYSSSFDNFSHIVRAYSPLINREVIFPHNPDADITSYGFGTGLMYFSEKGYKIMGNYNYAKANIEFAQPDTLGANSGNVTIHQHAEGNPIGFNTPTHRFNFSISNRDLFKGVGFSVKYRWSSAYTWQDVFGTEEIESFGIVDAALSYKVVSQPLLLKIGGANVFNNRYKTVFGGPTIGAQYYVSITFDQFLW